MKSRFSKGTPEYRDEMRKEALWLLAGLMVGFALALNVHLAPRKVYPATGFDRPCDRAICVS